MKKYITFILFFSLMFATEGFSVARTWIGIGAGGAGTVFNTGANWSPAGVPTSADALTIVINTGASSAITLSGSITVGSLDMTVTGARNGYLRANGFVLTVNGTANFNAVTYISNFPFAPSISYCEVDAGVAPGGFVFNGATQIHTTGAGDTYIGGANVGEGTMTFNANLTMGAWAYTNPGDEPIWAFDGTGAQSVIYASNYHIKPSSMRFGVVNSPTVTVTAVAPGLAPGNYFTIYDGSFIVNNATVLDIGNFDFDPWTANTGIQVNSTATLRIGDNNNFPGFAAAVNYSSYTISSTSTVHYNGGLGQSISNLASPGYGHIMYSGAGLKTSAGSFMIRGNWTNNGTFAHNNSTHTFNGTPNQTIGGTSATIFYNLVENKASGSLLMGITNNQVNNVLTLTAGPLDLNSFTLIVNNALTTAVVRTAGYIISETNSGANPSILQWNMGATTGAFVFHFGTTAGTYIPFTFNKTTGTASNVSISTRPTGTSANTPWATGVTHMYSPTLAQDGSDEAVIDRWWHITSSGAATANLTFTYRGAENTMIVPYNTGNVGAQYWGSAAWLPNNANIGSAAAVTAGTGSVTASGVAFTAGTFTPMVLSSLSAPLPVELVSFTGTCVGDFAELIWVTASETNNSHFNVLRSDNGEPFRVIGTVEGNETTSLMSDYNFVDEQPVGNSTMYRLVQYDFNGDNHMYAPISVSNCATGNSTVTTYASQEELVVLINSEKEGVFTVSVVDMQGRTISTQQLSAGEGSSKFGISKEGIAPGIYLVMTSLPNGEVTSEKIFIQ